MSTDLLEDMRRNEGTDGYGSNPTGQAWGCGCTCHEVSTFAQIFPPSHERISQPARAWLPTNFQLSTRNERDCRGRSRQGSPAASWSNFSPTHLDGCLAVTVLMITPGGRTWLFVEGRVPWDGKRSNGEFLHVVAVMPTIGGKKVACWSCIRGHRSSTCSHEGTRPMLPVRRPGRPLTSCPHLPNSDCGCPDSPKSAVAGPRVDWTLAESPPSSGPFESTSTHVDPPSSSPQRPSPSSGGVYSSPNDRWPGSTSGDTFTTSTLTWDNWERRGSSSPPSHHARDQTDVAQTGPVVLTGASSSQTPWSAAADPAQPFSNRLSGSSSYEAWMPSRNRESIQIPDFGAIEEDTFGNLNKSSLSNDTTMLGPEWDDSFGGQASFFDLPPYEDGSASSHHEWPAN